MRDYLGSVRAVYDITQEAEDVTDVESLILEQNDYYAFGGRIEDPTQPMDQDNRYRFNGKEQLRFDGIGLDPNLTDYGARYYESRYARWTTPDPLADKYYSTSPYAFCNNNPVNFVDPFGMDWYSTTEEIEDESGKKRQVTRYHWTEAKSQEEMYGLGIEGTYLGEAVVVFNGYYDEKVGINGSITGDGGKAAKVTVFGSAGANDIQDYIGYTMTSDYKTFGAIDNGVYDVTYRVPGKGGKLPSNYAVNDGGDVDCLNGINPSPAIFNPSSDTKKNGIYIHSTNSGGKIPYNIKDGWAVSSGCLLINNTDWQRFCGQIGKRGFKLILNRK